MRGFVALSILVACGRGAKPEPIRALAGDLVIANVTIVPMDRDTTIAGQTVIVRGDKIAAIAPHERVEVPAGATRIDGTGKWLMPGLADMHVHTWNETDLTMFVAAGVTTVRNMFGSEQHFGWRKEIAEGKRFGPTIVTASPIIDGDPPVWPGSIVITKPDEADGKVAAVKGQGYDFLKPYSRLDKPAYEALAAAAKKHGMTLQGHVPNSVGIEGVLAAGQKSIEHLDGWLDALGPPIEKQSSYWKRHGMLAAQADESKIPQLAEAMKKAGTWNCATLIVMSRIAALDDVPALEKRVRWLEHISPQVRAFWNPKADFRIKSATAEDFAAMRATNTMRGKIARVLATSGAPMIVGTDTGNPYVVPGAAMLDEIELLVAAGAPRARVMRSATADAAAFLGLAGASGVVAAGARADLLLVSVDPLVTPLPLGPDGVVLRGQWLPKAELEKKLLAKPVVEDRFKAMPPLAPEGKDVVELHYEILGSDDAIVGEERLARGLLDNRRVIVSQLVNDQPAHIETTYRITGQTTRLEQKTSFGTTVLDARPDGKNLVATGKTSAQDVSLTKPLPADAFIASPGIGGTLELADKITGMKVGDMRRATSVELSTFPQPAIETATYEVTRKPDAAGNQAFSIVITLGEMKMTSELVLDSKGIPVEQSFGPPAEMKFVRRQ